MNKNNQPIFTSQSITKRYGPTIALNNVEIFIYPGEVRGFIGENGSGKSTMAALMTGIHDVTSGTMAFQSSEWVPLSTTDALNRGIGIVVQENGTIPPISVAENIFLGALNQFKGVNFFEQYKVENFSPYFDHTFLVELQSLKETISTKLAQLKADGEEAYYAEKRFIKLIQNDKVLSKDAKLKEISPHHDALRKAKMVMLANRVAIKALQKEYDSKLKEAYNKKLPILLAHNLAHKEKLVEEYNEKSTALYEKFVNVSKNINEAFAKEVDGVSEKVYKRRHAHELKGNEKKYISELSRLDRNYELQLLLLKNDVQSFKNYYINARNLLYKKHESSFVEVNKHRVLSIVFGLFVNRRKLNKYAQLALNQIGVTHIRAEIPCGAYDMQDRKLIEIAKVLYKNPTIFIVDETTTSLSETGRAILYGQMERLKNEGKSVLFISHDLEEIKEKCDTLTVLRDGNIVATLDKSKGEFIDDVILKAMIGRELNGAYYREDYDGSYGDEVVLKMVDGIEGKKLRHVNVELHKGEILGIGGLSESGMRELGQALFGHIKMEGGYVYSGPELKTIITSEVTAMANKIGYLPKNRDTQGLSQKDSIFNNIALASLNNVAKLNLFVFKGSERKVVNKQVRDLSIKANSSQDLVSTLSGGNKQKVSLAKWLGNESEILILDCPTRGVDVGVKQFIYQLMYAMKKEGRSILMISEELPELIGMSDRILIMKDGKIMKEFNRDPELTQDQIVKYMI